MASSLKFSGDSSPVQKRYAAQMAASYKEKYGEYDITYNHASMCQVFLPYQDSDQDVYVVTQGNHTMTINGHRYPDTETGEEIRLGVPSGTRARLLLYLINEQAILSGEKTFQLANSISDLCRKLRIPRSGRSMTEVKTQLERLCTASFSLKWSSSHQRGLSSFFIIESIVTNGTFKDMDYATVEGKIKGFQVTLSDKYFESILKSGVPLDKRTITALQNNSMCLDIYNWLTHRLYRIPKGEEPFITWKQIKDQFGHGFGTMHSFKRDFRKNLTNVRLQYREAKIMERKNKGFVLNQSAPPIAERLLF